MHSSPSYRYLVVVLPEHEQALLDTIAERGGKVRANDVLYESTRPYFAPGGERRWAVMPTRIRVEAAFATHTTGLRSALLAHTKGATFRECYVRLAEGSPRPRAAKTRPGPQTPKRKMPRLTVVMPQRLKATRLYFATPDEAMRERAEGVFPPFATVHLSHCGDASGRPQAARPQAGG